MKIHCKWHVQFTSIPLQKQSENDEIFESLNSLAGFTIIIGNLLLILAMSYYLKGYSHCICTRDKGRKFQGDSFGLDHG